MCDELNIPSNVHVLILHDGVVCLYTQSLFSSDKPRDDASQSQRQVSSSVRFGLSGGPPATATPARAASSSASSQQPMLPILGSVAEELLREQAVALSSLRVPGLAAMAEVDEEDDGGRGGDGALVYDAEDYYENEDDNDYYDDDYN